eukprot:1189424-Prorocentrum_minimum.AAC.1
MFAITAGEGDGRPLLAGLGVLLPGHSGGHLASHRDAQHGRRPRRLHQGGPLPQPREHAHPGLTLQRRLARQGGAVRFSTLIVPATRKCGRRAALSSIKTRRAGDVDALLRWSTPVCVRSVRRVLENAALVV